MFTIQGKITKIKETQYKGEKQYPVREFHFVPSNTPSNNPILFTALGNKTELLDNISENEEVVVKFTINSSEYKERIYNTLSMISIDVISLFKKDTPSASSSSSSKSKKRYVSKEEIDKLTSNKDDLPF
jgi:hypothetical protein